MGGYGTSYYVHRVYHLFDYGGIVTKKIRFPEEGKKEPSNFAEPAGKKRDKEVGPEVQTRNWIQRVLDEQIKNNPSNTEK